MFDWLALFVSYPCTLLVRSEHLNIRFQYSRVAVSDLLVSACVGMSGKER